MAAAKMTAETRKTLARLRKLFASTEEASVNQAGSLLETLGDAQVSAIFAEGCAIGEEGRLVIGDEVLKRARAAFRTLVALWALRASGALRKARVLNLDVSETVECPTIVDVLTGMSSLEVLALRTRSSMDLTPLATCTGLKRLRLNGQSGWREPGGLEDLSVLASLTGLEELTIRACSASDFGALAPLEALQVVDLDSCSNLTDLQWLRDKDQLRSLTLSWSGYHERSHEDLTDLTPITQLGSLTTLRLSDFHAHNTEQSAGQLRELLVPSCEKMTSLQELHLHATTSDLTPFCAAPNIELLRLAGPSDVKSLRPVANLKGLRWLAFDGVMEELESLDGIEGCTSLQHFGSQLGRRGDDPGAPGALTAVCLDSCPKLVDINALGAFETLESVKMLNVAVPSAAAFAKLTSLKSLTIARHRWLRVADQFADFDGIEALQGLETLSVISDKIERLAGLRGLPKLSSVDVHQAAISSLDGLADLPSLRTLGLSGSVLTSLDGVEQFRGLTSLSACGCSSLTNVDALYSLADLSCVNLVGTDLGLGKATSEQEERASVLRYQKKLWKKISAADPTAPKPAWLVQQKGAKVPGKIMRLLRMRDHLQVAQGVALLDGLGVQGPVERLLDGAKLEDGVLKSGPQLTRKKDQEYLDYATHLLLEIAPKTHPLRKAAASAKTLVLEGLIAQHAAGIGVFTSVETLTLRHARLTDLSGYAGAKTVTSLTLGLSTRQGYYGNRWVRDCTFDSLAGLEGLTALETLELQGCHVGKLDALAGCARLRSLTMYGCSGAGDLGPLAGLTALESLVWGHDSVPSLAPLRGLSGLKHVDLSGCRGLQTVDGLDQVPGIVGMSTLTLSGSFTDLQGLTALSNLTSLHLIECSALTSLDGLEHLTGLESLDLTGSDELHDLSAIRGLSALASLNLSRWGYRGSDAMGGLEVGPKAAVFSTRGAVSAYQKELSEFLARKTAPVAEEVAESDLFAGLPAAGPLSSGDRRKVLAAIKKAVRSGDLAICKQGIARAVALADEALFQALLKGCSVTGDTASVGEGTITRSKTFRAKKALMPTVWYGFLGLVGAAPPAARPESLNALKTLDLRHACLQGLPGEIGGWESLTHLTLSHVTEWNSKGDRVPYDSKLGDLPAGLGGLTNLQVLQLSGCAVTSLPETVGQLRSLRSLFLSDNALTSLPESFGALGALETLKLERNKLARLPDSFGHLGALQTCDLDHNALTGLPPLLGGLERLQTLSLITNPIASLPPSFGELSALQVLDLSGHMLTILPETFGDLGSLRELSLANSRRSQRNHSPLTSLPKSFVRLASLEKLDLTDNVVTLPAGFGGLTALTEFTWSDGCPLTRVPDDFSKLSNLKTFDWRSAALTECPDFSGMSELRKIAFNANETARGSASWRWLCRNREPFGALSFAVTDRAGPVAEPSDTPSADRYKPVRDRLRSRDLDEMLATVDSLRDPANEDLLRYFAAGCGVTETGRIVMGTQVRQMREHFQTYAALVFLARLGVLDEVQLLDLSWSRMAHTRLLVALPPELYQLTSLTHLAVLQPQLKRGTTRQNLPYWKGTHFGDLANLEVLVVSATPGESWEGVAPAIRVESTYYYCSV
jgi:Leucine-rich repeat (LRR) protein